jgi:hypothetical protein
LAKLIAWKFCLDGNHEMYARGFAYFDRILPALGPMLHGKPCAQKASFFCLENEYWRIIGLDTAYGRFWNTSFDQPVRFGRNRLAGFAKSYARTMMTRAELFS